ncbi:MAG: UDP-3-O-(3-hydroxymyristoyl)glucosamine N-acyltransferase [Planctomycetota bacterium]
MKVSDIVKIVNGEFIQNNSSGLEYEIVSINCLQEATEKEISFFYDTKYKEALGNTRSLYILTDNTKEYIQLCKSYNKNVIVVSNIRKSIIKVARLFYKEKKYDYEISSFAYISPSATIADRVYIAPYVYIGENTVIGEGSKILPFCFIGDECYIGKNCIIYPNVTIYSRVYIGNGVIINSGCVIGVDGFGFFRGEGNICEKFPHFGKVVIEDDVEIFANSCISRATFGTTVISRGTKIDSLVQIAHNVKIGDNTIIAAQTGISGHCNIGRNVTVAGQVGVIDHVKIGDNSIITAKSGIAKNIPPDSIYSGIHAIEQSIWKRLVVLLPKLPHLIQNLKTSSSRPGATDE